MQKSGKTLIKGPWAQTDAHLLLTLPFRMVRRGIGFLQRNNLGVEIALYDTNWICNYPGEKVAELSRLLRDAGIEVAVHGPIHDLNPGSLDVVIRDYTRHCYFKTLAICHALAAKSLVLHLGVNPLLPESALNSWLESSILTWKPLVDLAEQLSMTILLENMFVPSPRFLVALKNGLKSHVVKFCFDVGHFNVYSRTPLNHWLDELGADIAEVHLNDNRGLQDEHLALGKGTIDFRRFFHELRARDAHPRFTVEMTREKFDASLSYLKENRFIAPLAMLSNRT
ncbi:sugar phosphate isomerase/epimerase [Candidatus Poribacteria bacterium]|nr:sugar phosphate isomerase/epimerase [Candidatus Poribacteria bacterium]